MQRQLWRGCMRWPCHYRQLGRPLLWKYLLPSKCRRASTSKNNLDRPCVATDSLADTSILYAPWKSLFSPLSAGTIGGFRGLRDSSHSVLFSLRSSLFPLSTKHPFVKVHAGHVCIYELYLLLAPGAIGCARGIRALGQFLWTWRKW